jgi:acetyltransferase-like isoleucine patch superfamily enzyme
MKRDIAGESKVNFVFRAYRSAMIRLRGRFFYFMRMFSSSSKKQIGFEWGAKFINSKRLSFKGPASFGRMARLECHTDFTTGNTGQIIFGSNISFGDYFHAGSLGLIEVGDNVLGGSNILLVDHNHGSPRLDMTTKSPIPPRNRPLTHKGPIKIGNNCWLGDGVTVLGGVEIGEGAIIAAKSVVRKNVLPWTIYDGR